MPTKVIPTVNGLQDNPMTRAVWTMIGTMLMVTSQELGSDLAISLIISRVSQELRRNHGCEEAAKVLHDYANQQADIAALERAYGNQ